MLTSSDVKFFNSYSKMAVQFEIGKISNSIQEAIFEGSFKINIDSEKLFLVNKNDKHRIALIYNVEFIDAQVGWLLRQMCMTSDNLGFIISPLVRWYRHRVIDCYKAVKANKYEVYLDLKDLEKGYIYLVIDWMEFLRNRS